MDFYRPISIFKNIWWFLLLNFIWGGLASLYYNEDAFQRFDLFLEGVIFGFTISTTYVYGFILIWLEMDKLYPWISQPGKRIFYGIFYGLLYAMVSYAVVTISFWFIAKGGQIELAWANFLYGWKYPVINFFPSALIVCAVAFFKNWSRSVINKEKLQAEMMQYKFESLQNQLNPHFLFNSFNVLSNLVYDDKQLAIRFVDQLQEIYEYVLDSKDKNLVELKDELAFIDSFTFLLKMRFEDKLKINNHVDPQADCLVAPMVLQLLIENAVKHNIITKQNPLEIDIRLKDDYLEVSNSLQPKKTIEKSTKMGLENIKQRYELISSLPVRVEKSSVFKVSIPIVRRKGQNDD